MMVNGLSQVFFARLFVCLARIPFRFVSTQTTSAAKVQIIAETVETSSVKKTSIRKAIFSTINANNTVSKLKEIGNIVYTVIICQT